MKLKSLFTLIPAVFATACTTVGLSALNVPASMQGGYTSQTISYGAEEWAKADVYMPTAAPAEPKDVIVFFYGGRWSFGKRGDSRFVGARLAKQGFVVVIPDYRKYPDVRFPAFVQDGAKAVAWAADHAAEYGGNPAHLHLAGHSAGAHIGALLTADESYLKAEGKDTRTLVKSFVGLAGPYDFTPYEADLIDMFGPPDRFPLMQVTTFIDGREPPMLLQHGNDDTTVESYNHAQLAGKIREKGGRVEVKTYPGVGHINIFTAFSWAGGHDKVVDDMVAYFRQNR